LLEVELREHEEAKSCACREVYCLGEDKDTHGEESVPEKLSPELFFSSLEPKGQKWHSPNLDSMPKMYKQNSDGEILREKGNGAPLP